jgi:hypothetical protein
MKLFLYFFIFLCLTSTALAFDCSLASDVSVCEGLLASEIDRVEIEEALSALLYENTSSPDHTFVLEYNAAIEVDSAPENTQTIDSTYIKDAWVSLDVLSLSVYEDGTLLVAPEVEAIVHSDYSVYIPASYSANKYPETNGDYCQITYSLASEDVEDWFEVNDELFDTTQLTIDEPGDIYYKQIVTVQISSAQYKWKKYLNRRTGQYEYKCQHYRTLIYSDNVELEDSKEVSVRKLDPSYTVLWSSRYRGTTVGEFYPDNYANIELSFANASYTQQQYVYHLVFEKEPHDFAVLVAKEVNTTAIQGMYIDENTFYVANTNLCQVTGYNHFFSITQDCEADENLAEVSTAFSSDEQNYKLTPLYYIIVLGLTVFLVFKLLSAQLRKFLPYFIIPLLLLPSVFAADDSCGLTNLSSCIPEAMYDFILSIINMTLSPGLEIIQNLLTSEISIELFYHTWSIIRYLITFFYLFFFVYAGIVLLVGSASPIQRAHAKDMLKNTVFMIILIQGSYYLYDLVITLSSSMSSAILSLIDPTFFMLTADNIINIGLEFMFTWLYSLTLIFTILLLTFRYIVVATGVIVLPIAFFCFFIPPLKAYGKFMLSVIGLMLFITFIDLLIILACSALVEIALFESMKILVMIVCFLFINYTLFLCTKFAFAMSVNGSLKDDVKQAAKYVALLV